MNIVIAGAGEVGSHLAKMLSNESHDIVVIDNDETRLQRVAQDTDLITIKGNSNSFHTLKEANIKKADLFIAVNPSKEQDMNITSAIIAKQMGAHRVVARINNSEYLAPNNKEFFTNLGIDYIFYPESIACKEIVTLLKQTSSTEYIDFSDGKLFMTVLKLDEGAPVLDQRIDEVMNDREDFLYQAVAINRNGETIIPGHDDVFKLNDMVYVISSNKAMDEVLEYAGKTNIEVRNIMISGGSYIGSMLALKLRHDYNVKLIEGNRERCEELTESLPNVLVINGEPSDTDLLLEEDLRNMDAFVAVSENSEVNILSCMIAKRYGVKRTIAEIENLNYIKLAESVGVDTVINKKLIAASRIFRFTMESEVQTIRCLTGSDAEVMEFIAKPGSPAVKNVVKDLRFPKGAIIGGIVRGDNGFIVSGKTQIKAYDRVVVFALPSSLNKVGKYFG